MRLLRFIHEEISNPPERQQYKYQQDQSVLEIKKEEEVEEEGEHTTHPTKTSLNGL